jgi:hypothetical protein
MAGGNLRCDMDNALGADIGVLLFNPERMEVPTAKGREIVVGRRRVPVIRGMPEALQVFRFVSLEFPKIQLFS